ncbi:MAG TPA: BMA_0021/BMA_0022 family TOMM bacteriocin [Polyangiaceae bacterium]|nr:BMA_0021/BMA_0022 family TOMM bacteriocin [Polyangiaceae bacterium]
MSHDKILVDPLKAYDQIAKWERVWAEAVALAWRQWDQANGFKDALLADPRKAILDRFGFQLPLDVDLRVEVSKQPADYDKGTESWQHPRAVSHLTLTLPKPPAKVEDQAIALSHYVASGRSMPFTCCC